MKYAITYKRLRTEYVTVIVEASGPNNAMDIGKLDAGRAYSDWRTLWEPEDKMQMDPVYFKALPAVKAVKKDAVKAVKKIVSKSVKVTP